MWLFFWHFFEFFQDFQWRCCFDRLFNLNWSSRTPFWFYCEAKIISFSSIPKLTPILYSRPSEDRKFTEKMRNLLKMRDWFTPPVFSRKKFSSPTKKLTETELMVYNKFEVSSFRKNKHFYEIQSLLADKLELIMEFENIYTSKTSILGHFWAYYQNFKYVLTI